MGARPHGRQQPHLADLRSAQRTSAGAVTGRRTARGRSGGAAAAARRVRLVDRPAAGGALHHLPRDSGLSHRLQQQLPHRPDPGSRRHPAGAHPRGAADPARRPAARRRRHPAVAGRLAGPLGRRHAGRRDDELLRAVAAQERQRRPVGVAARHRALHARRPGHDRLRVHRHRPRHLDAAVVGLAAAHRLRGTDVRVRLPRGKLRPGERPGRRPRPGAGRSARREQLTQ